MRIALALAAVASASILQAPPATAGFAPGQCTTWAYEMRPDIIAGTELADPKITDWNAYRWAANAQLGGFSVGSRPAVGAIAVWPQNTLGAGAVGHVAYVERVRSDGSFYVSEENFDGNPNVHHRWVAPTSALQFIYLAPGERAPKAPTQLGGALESLKSQGLYSTTDLSRTSVTFGLSAPGTVALRLSGPGLDRRYTWRFHAGGSSVDLGSLSGTSSLPAGTYTLTAFSYDSGLHHWWVSFRLA